MRRKAFVLHDFMRFTHPALIEFARNHKKLITGNTQLPNPDVSPAQIGTDTDAVETEYIKARKGDHEAVKRTDANVKILRADLVKNAKYVDRIANGDEAIILGSGFHTTITETHPTAAPGKPDNFKAVAGIYAGSIHLSMNKLPFANFFVYMAGPDLNGISYNGNMLVVGAIQQPVIIFPDKHRNVDIQGLKSGAVYQCKVFGVSSAGKGPDSDIISILAP